MLIILLPVPSSWAQTNEQLLQQQIQALQEQIALLLQQLSTMQGGTPPPVTQGVFTHWLQRGSTDAATNGEVSRLQQFLAKDLTIYPEGTVSGYFGALTETAVQRWQKKMNIVTSGTPSTTGYGAVGPKTREALNRAMGTAPSPVSIITTGDITITKPASGSASGSNTITLVLNSGTVGSMTLTQNGLPDGGSAAALSSCTPTCSRANTLTIKSTTPAGVYPITITAEAGPIKSTLRYNLRVVAPTPFGFTLTNSGNIVVTRPVSGSVTATNTISAWLSSGTSQQLTFTQSGLPANASAASIQSCKPNCDKVNTLTIKSSTPEGTYPITVTASGGGATMATIYNLVVLPPIAFNFHLSNSGNITIAKPLSGPRTATNQITATLDAGASQTATFNQSGFPAGASGVALSTCTPTCTKVNTVTIGANTPAGTYPITVTATAGGIVSTTIYNLIVTPYVPFQFGMSISGDLAITRPSSGTASGANTVALNYIQGIADVVTFTQSGLPVGSGYALAGCTPACSPTNTITINSSTPLGTYPITITAANDGKATTTISYYLHVQ